MSKLVDCPHCGHDESHVYLCKKTRKGGYRRHRCLNDDCGKRFTSIQSVREKVEPKRKPRSVDQLAGLARRSLQRSAST